MKQARAVLNYFLYPQAWRNQIVNKERFAAEKTLLTYLSANESLWAGNNPILGNCYGSSSPRKLGGNVISTSARIKRSHRSTPSIAFVREIVVSYRVIHEGRKIFLKILLHDRLTDRRVSKFESKFVDWNWFSKLESFELRNKRAYIHTYINRSTISIKLFEL